LLLHLSCVIAYALLSEGGCILTSRIMTLAKGVVACQVEYDFSKGICSSVILKRRGL